MTLLKTLKTSKVLFLTSLLFLACDHSGDKNPPTSGSDYSVKPPANDSGIYDPDSKLDYAEPAGEGIVRLPDASVDANVDMNQQSDVFVDSSSDSPIYPDMTVDSPPVNPCTQWTVTPAGSFGSYGPQGGPFSPANKTYTVTNIGNNDITVLASANQSWISVSPSSTTVSSGNAQAFVVAIGSAANSLGAGTYTGAVTIQNSSCTQTITVVLTVTNPCSLWNLLPTDGFNSSGVQGGPFSPTKKTYTVVNNGTQSLTIAITANKLWVSIDQPSLSVAAGASASVNVSINNNANSLTAGTHTSTVDFSSSSCTASRTVTLTAYDANTRWAISPADSFNSTGAQGGPFTPASKTYTAANVGNQSIPYSASVDKTWLTVTPPSGTVPQGATHSIVVSVNSGANSLQAGTYTATISFVNGTFTETRDVTLTVTDPCTLWSIASEDALNASGPKGGSFSPATKTYTITNSGTNDITFSGSADVNWIDITPDSGTIQPGIPQSVVVSINSSANTLEVGSYTATVTFTNGTCTIERLVNLTVHNPCSLWNITPSGGLESVGPRGGLFTPSTQSYAVKNTGGQPLTVAATVGETWMTVSPATQTLAAGATGTVTITINSGANSLGAGTYTDTLTLSGNGCVDTRTISLEAYNPCERWSVTPDETFSSTGPQGGPFSPTTKTYTVTNTGDTSITVAVTKTESWVNVSPASLTVPAGSTGTVTVSFTSGADSLVVGTHTDTITFTNGSCTNTKPVSLSVYNPCASPAMVVSPSGSLDSTGPTGGPFTPSSKAYTITNTGAQSITVEISPSNSWVTTSAATQIIAAGATATVNIGIGTDANSLAAGTYAARVTFSDGTCIDSRVVNLVVTNPCSQWAVSPSSGFSSTGPIGGPFSPANQTYTVSNSGTASFTVTASVNKTWLQVIPASATVSAGGSQALVVSFTSAATSLTAGTHVATVTFTTSYGCTASRTVTLFVYDPCTLWSMSPETNMSSSGNKGGPFSPSEQTYVIANNGTQSISITVTKDINWITVTPSSATIPASGTQTITASINSNANGLVAGLYTGTITVTNGTCTFTRSVRLVVIDPCTLWSISPSSNFESTGPKGGPFSPDRKNYTVTNSGQSSITVTVASSKSWVTTTPSSATIAAGGTGSFTLSLLGPSIEALDIGTHTATVTFTNGSCSFTKTVTLIVTDPCLDWTVTPSGGFASAGPYGGPFSPASQSYSVENIGKATFIVTGTASKNWITISPSSQTVTPGSALPMNVIINSNANSLAIGTHTATVTFTTDKGCTTSRTVTLTVSTLAITCTLIPTGAFSPTGPAGGPFSPSSQGYTLTVTETATGKPVVGAIYTDTVDVNWTTVSPSSGTTDSNGKGFFTATINSNANSKSAGSYTGTITLSVVASGGGTCTTTRTVNLTITQTAVTCSLTPATSFDSAGVEGGTFSPSQKTYTLTVLDGVGDPVAGESFTVSKSQSWVTVSPTSGTTNGSGQATITVSINSNAQNLSPGSYSDSVVVATSGCTATQTVNLEVTACDDTWTISPVADWNASGTQGGPFSPSSNVYTATYQAGYSGTITTSVDVNWITVTGTNPFTATINSNANSLVAGTYTGVITFTNAYGCTITRRVVLTVNAPVVPPNFSASTKAVSPTGKVQAGSSLVYTIVVRNTGAGAATTVRLTDTLNANLSFVSASSTQGSCAHTAGVVTCTIGSMAAGATVTVTINVTVSAMTIDGTSICNSATITANEVESPWTTNIVCNTVDNTAPTCNVLPATPFTPSGAQGGPFSPTSKAYTVTNSDVDTLTVGASKTQTWLTVSVSPTSITPGQTSTVTVSLNSGASSLPPGTYADTVTITVTDPAGNFCTTTRSVTLTVTGSCSWSVDPSAAWDVTLFIGDTDNQTYTITNSGSTSFNYTVAVSDTWMSASPTSGTLSPGASVAINVTVSPLSEGSFTGTITFTNSDGLCATITRTVNLTAYLACGDQWAISPASMTFSGPQGGPFSPASQDFTIANAMQSTMNVTVSADQNWVTFNPTSLSIPSKNIATVATSINSNANGLPAGSYMSIVTFTNNTGCVQTAEIRLTIIPVAHGL